MDSIPTLREVATKEYNQHREHVVTQEMRECARLRYEAVRLAHRLLGTDVRYEISDTVERVGYGNVILMTIDDIPVLYRQSASKFGSQPTLFVAEVTRNSDGSLKGVDEEHRFADRVDLRPSGDSARLLETIVKTIDLDAQLVEDLLRTDDCRLDHNGACQDHLWFPGADDNPVCPYARLREVWNSTGVSETKMLIIRAVVALRAHQRKTGWRDTVLDDLEAYLDEHGLKVVPRDSK